MSWWKKPQPPEPAPKPDPLPPLFVPTPEIVQVTRDGAVCLTPEDLKNGIASAIDATIENLRARGCFNLNVGMTVQRNSRPHQKYSQGYLVEEDFDPVVVVTYRYYDHEVRTPANMRSLPGKFKRPPDLRFSYPVPEDE